MTPFFLYKNKLGGTFDLRESIPLWRDSDLLLVGSVVEKVGRGKAPLSVLLKRKAIVTLFWEDAVKKGNRSLKKS